MAKRGVIIVAGGSGRRMGATLPKQFMMLGNEPILARSINRIHEALPAAEIVVVLPKEHVELWRNLAARFEVAEHRIALGGEERFHSVRNGIEALSDAVDLIAVQDGVRPFASKAMIRKTAECAKANGAAIPVVTPVDSFRWADGDESKIINRDNLRIVQTPQIFEAGLLRAAYDTDFDARFTDDASVVEAFGHKIALCEGERTNIKITTPDDMIFAEAIIKAQKENDL
jgi:2-C-methyl-D-erythritol 4-phosphate cytidylyltransferase